MIDNNAVNHPAHYGGEDNPYEAIKVIEAWGLGFCLGNAVKYIARHNHKGSAVEDLCKARWYLDREITSRGAEHASPAETDDYRRGYGDAQKHAREGFAKLVESFRDGTVRSLPTVSTDEHFRTLTAIADSIRKGLVSL